jgi:hypothetical protein
MDLKSIKNDINNLDKDLSELNDDISKIIPIDTLREVSEAITKLNTEIKNLRHDSNIESNMYYIWHRINDNKDRLLNTVDYFNSYILNKLTNGSSSDKEVLNGSSYMISSGISRALVITIEMDIAKLHIDAYINNHFK